jgi:hypothetical protein
MTPQNDVCSIPKEDEEGDHYEVDDNSSSMLLVSFLAIYICYVVIEIVVNSR